MPTVVCFGDSITWGCPPYANIAQLAIRMPRANRWPHVMAARLGEGVEVIAEGLSSRTTVFDDPVEGSHKNATRTLIAILESHEPIDVFVIMLGSNDFKLQYSCNAFNSARGMLTLVQMIKGHYALATGCPQIMIVTPPAITTAAEPEFWGDAHRRCQGHAYYLEQVAMRTDCFHFDANKVVSASVDGVHIDEEGHRTLGEALAPEIHNIMRLNNPSAG